MACAKVTSTNSRRRERRDQMRRLMAGVVAVVVGAAVTTGVPSAQKQEAASTGASHTVATGQFEQWKKELSN
jgi:predicted benzoate:H+ symporter BenE